VTRVYQRPIMRLLDTAADAEVTAQLQSFARALIEEGWNELAADGSVPATLTAEVSLDMRYAGQSYELEIPLQGTGVTGAAVNLPAVGTIRDEFHKHHLQRYGHADRTRAVEIVNMRCRVAAPGLMPELAPPPQRLGGVERARLATVPQWHGDWLDAPVYDRDLLCAGDSFAGPAVVVQMDATTAVPPGWRAEVDPIGNLLLRAV
jgi:N-methylhydantoinase A